MNANSEPAKGKAGEQGNQYNNIQNWIGGKVEVKAPIIAIRELYNILLPLKV